MKYKLKCAYCGKDFESGRSNALYCSNSCRTMNNRQKKQNTAIQPNGALYKIEYSNNENNTIRKKAEMAEMKTKEYIKFLSLSSVKDCAKLSQKVTKLEDTNKKLKAKLSFYSDAEPEGICLNVNLKQEMAIYEQMEEIGGDFKTVEEYIVYASMNLAKIIANTVNETFGELRKKRIIR